MVSEKNINFSIETYNSKKFYVPILFILCLIVLIPSFNNGFFGDDYSWLLQGKESTEKNVGTVFFEPAPYEYFRPIPKVLFALLWRVFPLSPPNNEGKIFFYRLFVLLLHILTTLIFYKLIEKKFNSKIAFISACFFSVIACHSETLYSINCINEMLSALFIFSGLLLFLTATKFLSLKILFSTIFFLLAVLSRESAFCFILLLFLFDYIPQNIQKRESPATGRKIRVINKIIIFALISVIYLVLRLISYHYYSDLYTSGSYGMLDTNPIKYFYKILHYFINIIFPVKSIFYFIGFENYERLRGAFLNPSENIKLFIILFISVVLILSILIYLVFFIIKSQRNYKGSLLNYRYFTLIFPVLFTLFALIIYLPLDGTAERFLYLPSAGICLLFAFLFLSIFSSYERKFSRVLIISIATFILVIYTLSIYQRAFIWKSASVRTKILLSKVEEKINRINTEDKNKSPEHKTSEFVTPLNVLMLDIPTIEKGTYFVNQYNFNHIWKFYFPNQKVKFWFYEKPENTKIDLLFSIKDLE